ncbi:TnsD family Tn7-like transposition protein [Brevibacillus centrosporus]|uniref:TnsD family Tn7-like transposition protein n=1 Tax=Brevibacillus centrosporus TaxID=54910 RepID=UPI003B013336
MLHYFPTPYPDELLYSVFARYHVWSRNRSCKATIKDLFGRDTVTAVIDFPNNLRMVCDQLSTESILTPEYLVQHHTLFPLFRPFLPEKRVTQILQVMKGEGYGKRQNIHLKIGVMGSDISIPQFLRYCKECFYNDIDKYGEPYWHRSHQVPGVIVCATHRTPLRESTVAWSSRQNKQGFISLTEDKMNNKEQLEFQSIHEHAYELADEVHWLLQHELRTNGLENMRAYYIEKLKRRGLATHSGRARQKYLFNSLLEHYGVAYLVQIHSLFHKNDIGNWLTKMWRKPQYCTHPIRHILLINFLGDSVRNLTLLKFPSQPFSNGVCPSFNDSSAHFWQDAIAESMIENKVSAKRVRQYNEGGFEEKKEHLRKVWQQLILGNPSKNKSELRKLDQNTFSWLYCNDRAWLDCNSPQRRTRTKFTKHRPIVDWSKRDQILSKKVQECVEVELRGGNKPIRLTVCSIGHMIGKRWVIQSQIEKLPLTRQAIDEAVETVEDFRIRRVKYVSQKMRERGERITARKILREAAIRPDFSESVKRQIEFEVTNDLNSYW